MILTVEPITGNFVILDCTFAEKGPIKDAGFKFCSGRCEAKWRCARCADHRPGTLALAWWSPKPEIAARLAAYADDAANLALQPALHRQQLSRASDTSQDFPRPDGCTYRGFQKAGIAFVLDAWTRFKGALIADDMGLGKTVQALGLINAVPGIRRVLILCPKSLQLNWQREIDRWILDKQEPWKLYLAEKSLPVPPEANIVICNYDKLVGRPGAIVAPSLVQDKWDVIVYDEAHYLKNPKAARTEVALKGLPPAARRLLFLTGTPIENRPVEIQPLLEACAPDEFPFWPFVKRYCNAREEWVHRKKKVWKFDGAGNLEELNARLRGTVMVRRLKSEVLKELPAKVRQVVEFPMSADDEGLLEDEAKIFAGHEDAVMGAFAKSAIAESESVSTGFAESVSNLSAKITAAFTELAAIRHELGLAKVEPALEWLRNALESTSGKMIVFAHHHDVLDQLRAGLSDFSPVKVDGRDSNESRQEAVDTFQGSPACRVFLGQTQAAGVGITLTAASTVAFVESDWVPGKLTQAEDRAHRIGQTDSVNVYHLVFDRSLDARMLQLVLEKQAVQDAALDSEITVKLPAMDGLATGPIESGMTTEPVKVWPVATDEERAASKAALRFLAERCDGANKEDGAGFSKFDSHLGKSLAARPFPFTDGQVVIAKKMARKYQRQLPTDLKIVLLGGAA